MDESDKQGDKESEADEETLNNQEQSWLEEEQDELEFSDEEFEYEGQNLSNEEDLIYSFEEEEVEELGEFANGLTSNEETENEEGFAHLSDQERLSKKSGDDNSEITSVPVISESKLGLSVVIEDICANLDQEDFPDILSSASLDKQDALQPNEDQEIHETAAYPEPDLPDFPFTAYNNVQDEDFHFITLTDIPSRFAVADRSDDLKGIFS